MLFLGNKVDNIDCGQVRAFLSMTLNNVHSWGNPGLSLIMESSILARHRAPWPNTWFFESTVHIPYDISIGSYVLAQLRLVISIQSDHATLITIGRILWFV